MLHCMQAYYPVSSWFPSLQYLKSSDVHTCTCRICSSPNWPEGGAMAFVPPLTSSPLHHVHSNSSEGKGLVVTPKADIFY